MKRLASIFCIIPVLALVAAGISDLTGLAPGYPKIVRRQNGFRILSSDTNLPYVLLAQAPDLAPRIGGRASPGEIDYANLSVVVDADYTETNLVQGRERTFMLTCIGGYCHLDGTNLMMNDFYVKYRENQVTGVRSVITLKTNEVKLSLSGEFLAEIQQALKSERADPGLKSGQ